MIGILSDAHGNGPAFDLAIDVLRRHGAVRYVFLGDAVGYLPGASVVAALRGLGAGVRCVRGNHEALLLAGPCDPEREPVYQLEAARRRMDASDVAFVGAWPVQHTEAFAAGSARFVHGSPADPTGGYVYPDTDLAAFDVPEPFVFMGHTHRPFVRRHGATTFVNVGSCGLPRDHGALGAAALFDDRTGDVRILRFDISRATRRALAAAGPVHPSVVGLFDRKAETYYGERVENG